MWVEMWVEVVGGGGGWRWDGGLLDGRGRHGRHIGQTRERATTTVTTHSIDYHCQHPPTRLPDDTHVACLDGVVGLHGAHLCVIRHQTDHQSSVISIQRNKQ